MSDDGLDAYKDWLNDLLFSADLEDGEKVLWLGDNRWAIFAPLDGSVFVIQINKGKVKLA